MSFLSTRGLSVKTDVVLNMKQFRVQYVVIRWFLAINVDEVVLVPIHVVLTVSVGPKSRISAPFKPVWAD